MSPAPAPDTCQHRWFVAGSGRRCCLPAGHDGDHVTLDRSHRDPR